MPAPTLSLEHINKTFGGLVAIDEFGLDVYLGEVVALVGDNGAGKSTLIKIIAGVHRPTRGRMLIDGPTKQPSMIQAMRRGWGFRSSTKTSPSRTASRSI